MLEARPGWLLLLSAVLLPLANGRWSIAAVAWIAAIPLLRYARTTKRPVRGFFAAWGVLFLVRIISWFGLIPFPPIVFLITVAIGALFMLAPFWIDRVITPKLPDQLSTLVFPLAAVSSSFLVTLQSDTTWGAIAYTQTSVLPILQFASIFGLWGIAFLIYWTASIANLLWARAAANKALGRGASVFAAVIIAVVLFGVVRLNITSNDGHEVHIAALNPPNLMTTLSQEELMLFQRYFMKLDVDTVAIEAIIEKVRRSNQSLLSRSVEAAATGADFLVWPEGGLVAFDEIEEQTMFETAVQLARESNLYLGFAIGSLSQKHEERHENKVIWIAPTGETLGEYHKTQLVPHVEDVVTRKGSGRVFVADTRNARIGTVICYDMDNPAFIAEAGQQDVQVLFSPSSDWGAIADLHHRMAAFRAVEQGLILVRPANSGISSVVDWRGRVLASVNHSIGENDILEAKFKAQSRKTVYSQIGDIFPWLCLVLLPILMLAALISGRERHQECAE